MSPNQVHKHKCLCNLIRNSSLIVKTSQSYENADDNYKEIAQNSCEHEILFSYPTFNLHSLVMQRRY